VPDYRWIQWLIVTAGVVVVCIFGLHYYRDVVAIQKGLCQGTVPGQPGRSWVACK
jgi:hypothetical protein